MSDMRPAGIVPAVRRQRRLATKARVGSVGLLLAVTAAAAALPARATATTPPAPAPTPAPTTTVSPPPDSPFDEAVGGSGLATIGVPAVAAGAPAVQAVDATAWLVADLESGDVLAALNAHAPLPPASTLKLLTALALLPGLEPDTALTATEQDVVVEGSRVGLVPGHEYTLADLEHGILLASGNDAATALARLTGGLPTALRMMNDEAARLGAFDTNATTPHGMDEPGQVSSAYDLALIGRAVLADERMAALVRTPTYDFPGMDGETFQIQNQNRLLGSYEGTIGLKTGFTTVAGHTLVAAAERGDARLVAVVLGAEGRAETAAQSLLDWGFAAQPTAEPIGSLVTPDEVARARAEHDERPQPADGAVQQAVDEAVDSAVSVLPGWVWGGLLVLAVGGLLGLARRRRRRSLGRYSEPPSRSP